MSLMVFSKHLGPSLEEIARELRRLGVREIDLTVRPGGHVEPERVASDLPRAARELASHGVQIGMISTGIIEANAGSEAILRAAKALNIGFYKLGYFAYAGFGTLRRAPP